MLRHVVEVVLGGKTGVNLAFGKNLVGAFYPPEVVVIDPDMLVEIEVDAVLPSS